MHVCGGRGSTRTHCCTHAGTRELSPLRTAHLRHRTSKPEIPFAVRFQLLQLRAELRKTTPATAGGLGAGAPGEPTGVLPVRSRPVDSDFYGLRYGGFCRKEPPPPGYTACHLPTGTTTSAHCHTACTLGTTPLPAWLPRLRYLGLPQKPTYTMLTGLS